MSFDHKSLKFTDGLFRNNNLIPGTVASQNAPRIVEYFST